MSPIEQGQLHVQGNPVLTNACSITEVRSIKPSLTDLEYSNPPPPQTNKHTDKQTKQKKDI